MAPPPPRDSDLAVTRERGDNAAVGQRLGETLRAGGRVALMLDYDGTLREFEPDPAAALPTAPVRELLDALARDPRIDVTIISGRTPRDLETFLEGYLFCLIAEHGAVVRPCGARGWERLDEHVDYGWRVEMLAVFRTYAESTPGSFVEEKRTSLVWHYRSSDPDEGESKARHLAAELSAIAGGRPLVVRPGKKIVEVTAAEVNKGAAVLHVLGRHLAPYGLVVVAGDDVTDESMFRLDVPNLLSIKVGEGDTRARYRVPAPVDLRRFLGQAVAGGA